MLGIENTASKTKKRRTKQPPTVSVSFSLRNYSAAVEARSKSPFTMDDQTFTETRSFGSTFNAGSHINSSEEIASENSQNTVEMPNEDFYKPNAGLVSTFANSDRPGDPADTTRYMDQSSLQSSLNGQLIGSQQPGTGRNQDSGRPTEAVDVSHSDYSSELYGINDQSTNSQLQESGRKVAFENITSSIEVRRTPKPVVSAEARSRWAMLAVLAGVSKTENSEEIEESIEGSIQNQQYTTGSNYRADEGQPLGDRSFQESRHSKPTRFSGALSDVVDRERLSVLHDEVQDPPSEISTEYTSSMKRYLQTLGDNPLIDNRGLKEGFQLYNINEEQSIQSKKHVVEEDFGTQHGLSDGHSLDQNSRGEENSRGSLSRDERRFEGEVLRDGRFVENYSNDSGHRVGEDFGSGRDTMEQGFQYGAQALKESYEDGRRHFRAEVQSSEHGSERIIESGLEGLGDKFKPPGILAEGECHSSKSELDGEFNSGKHGLERNVLSGVEALERGFETGEIVVKQGFRSTGQGLKMGLGFGEHILEKEFQAGARNVEKELQGSNIAQDFRRRDHDLGSVLQSGKQEVERLLDGKVSQDVHYGETKLEHDLQSGAREIEHALAGHGLEKNLAKGEHELQGIKTSLQQRSREGEHYSKQALHNGIQGLDNALGRQSTSGNQTQGPVRGGPSRASPNIVLAGNGHANMPAVHQAGSSAPTRAGVIPGGLAPNPRVIRPSPNQPTASPHGSVPSSHGPAGAPYNARPGERKDQFQGGLANSPSMAPHNSGMHGMSSQVLGARPPLSNQKLGPNSNIPDLRPNQNLINQPHQPPPLQTRQGPNVQQNRSRPTANIFPTAAMAQAGSQMHQQPHPTNVDHMNQGNRQQTQQQQQQPMSNMQQNQSGPTVNAVQVGNRTQSDRPQIQPSHLQNFDQRKQGNRPLQPNQEHSSRKPENSVSPQGAAVHSGAQQTSAQPHAAIGTSSKSKGQQEPVSCNHGGHQPQSCPHKQREQSCHHQGHEAHLCPHKANAQICSHQPHDPRACLHQESKSQGSEQVCSHRGHDDSSCPHKQKARSCNHSGHEAHTCPHMKNAQTCSHRPHEPRECPHKAIHQQPCSHQGHEPHLCPHEVSDSASSNDQGKIPPQQAPQQGLRQQHVGPQQPMQAQQLDGPHQLMNHERMTNTQQQSNSRPPATGQQRMQRQQQPNSQQQMSTQQNEGSQERISAQQQSNIQPKSTYKQPANSQQSYSQQSNSQQSNSQQSDSQELTKSRHQADQQQQTAILKSSESLQKSSHQQYTSSSSQTTSQHPDPDAPFNPFQALLTTFTAQHQASITPNPGFIERKSPFPFTPPHQNTPPPPLSLPLPSCQTLQTNTQLTNNTYMQRC